MPDDPDISTDHVGGSGTQGEKRGAKREREKDEEQYILRLPHPLSEQMRAGLASKAKRDAAGNETRFFVHFVSERHAYFHLNEKRYAATLYDLPAIVESHKTADKRTYYKSTDVHQVLIVRLPEVDADHTPPPEPEKQRTDPDPYLLENGIAPASTGAAHRFHVPPPSFDAEQTQAVEHQIKWVVDNKVQFVRKKQRPEDDDVEIEVDETAVSVPPKPPALSTAPKPVSTTSRAAVVKPPTSTSAAPSASVPDSSKSAAPSAPVSSTPAAVATPNTAAPAAVVTPAASNAANADDDDDDDDDLAMFANELGNAITEDPEDTVKRRMEITILDGRIEEQKTKIKEINDEAGKMKNAVIQKRILRKLPEHEEKLKQLEEERRKLG